MVVGGQTELFGLPPLSVDVVRGGRQDGIGKHATVGEEQKAVRGWRDQLWRYLHPKKGPDETPKQMLRLG